MLIEVKENRMETEKRKLFLLINKKSVYQNQEKHLCPLQRYIVALQTMHI